MNQLEEVDKKIWYNVRSGLTFSFRYVKDRFPIVLTNAVDPSNDCSMKCVQKNGLQVDPSRNKA